MKEKNIIIFLCIFFTLTAIFISTNVITGSDFNFNKVELSFTNGVITEKLYYTPDKDYRTLYRNFQSPLHYQWSNGNNDVEMETIRCSEGKAYINEYDSSCHNFPEESVNCLANTLDNEYGCTFENVYGFKENQNYESEATFQLNPENIFLIKDNYYIKFVAYSKGHHVYLTEDNLITSENIIKSSSYLPGEDVIFYLPFQETITNQNVIEQSDFEFDSSFFINFLIIFYSFLPLILTLFIWYKYGKEKSFADVPSELSNYPKDRPGYEVANVFNPPFTQNDNIFASLFLELYNGKYLDFKNFNNTTYVKVLKETSKDNILNKFLKLIIKVKGLSKKEFFTEGYLDLTKAFKEYNEKIYKDYDALIVELGKVEENYLEKKGLYFIIISTVFLFFSFIFAASFFSSISGGSLFLIFMHNLLFAVIITILARKTALFISFKKEYYAEYLHWQSFKAYLNNSFAMRESSHEAVVLWGKYLVYASAFGISKKLLKRLKDINIIDENTYQNYSRINRFSALSYSAMNYSNSRSSGGGHSSGFSGSSSGGIGGGGGGGR